MDKKSVTIGVAIAIPEPWGDDLQEHRASYGDRLAWTIPTHITLLPPTQVPPARLTEVDAHLRRTCLEAESFPIVLGRAESFRPVTPTVFITITKGFDECVRLQRGVRSGPLQRNLTFDYHPHVTLAFDVADDILDRALEEHFEFRAEFTADVVTRYELGEDGIWLPEQDFALGPNG